MKIIAIKKKKMRILKKNQRKVKFYLLKQYKMKAQESSKQEIKENLLDGLSQKLEVLIIKINLIFIRIRKSNLKEMKKKKIMKKRW